MAPPRSALSEIAAFFVSLFVTQTTLKFQLTEVFTSLHGIASTSRNMLSALRRSALPFRLPRNRLYATVSNPQTLVEKIVQKYAVDLTPGTKVHSGDYVMIKPEHV